MFYQWNNEGDGLMDVHSQDFSSPFFTAPTNEGDSAKAPTLSSNQTTTGPMKSGFPPRSSLIHTTVSMNDNSLPEFKAASRGKKNYTNSRKRFAFLKEQNSFYPPPPSILNTRSVVIDEQYVTQDEPVIPSSFLPLKPSSIRKRNHSKPDVEKSENHLYSIYVTNQKNHLISLKILLEEECSKTYNISKPKVTSFGSFIDLLSSTSILQSALVKFVYMIYIEFILVCEKSRSVCHHSPILSMCSYDSGSFIIYYSTPARYQGFEVDSNIIAMDALFSRSEYSIPISSKRNFPHWTGASIRFLIDFHLVTTSTAAAGSRANSDFFCGGRLQEIGWVLPRFLYSSSCILHSKSDAEAFRKKCMFPMIQ